VIVAVDSSVLFAIFEDEAGGADWLDYLLGLQQTAQLIACDIVWAEIAPLFSDVESLREAMAAVDVSFSTTDEVAAFTAGEHFARYRKAGGPRRRMIPDFLIAAHAFRNAAGLATADQGYMRGHFPELKLFKP